MSGIVSSRRYKPIGPHSASTKNGMRIIQRIHNIGNYLIEIVSSMFCVLIKNNEIAHFITSAIHLEFCWLVPMGFDIQCIFTKLLKATSNRFCRSCHLALSFFISSLDYGWMNVYVQTYPSLYAGISRSHCLLILSIAQSNWLTFCSFARHFQCGCFIRAVCCLSFHNAQCTMHYMCWHLFCICPHFSCVCACVRARARAFACVSNDFICDAIR